MFVGIAFLLIAIVLSRSGMGSRLVVLDVVARFLTDGHWNRAVHSVRERKASQTVSAASLAERFRIVFSSDACAAYG